MGKLVRFPSTRRARRTWHGAHVERGLLARAAGARGGGGLTGGTIFTLALATFLGVFVALDMTAPEAAADSSPLGLASPVSYGLCPSSGGANCVVDGDTFRHGGERIRILDIDAPETHPPRCAREARLGEAATDRLHALLNAGEVRIARQGEDRYGRTLARVTADGRPVGDVLIAEGLARPYAGGRRPWC